MFFNFGLSAAEWDHKTRDLASYGIPSFVVVLMVNAILLVIGTGTQWMVWQVLSILCHNCDPDNRSECIVGSLAVR